MSNYSFIECERIDKCPCCRYTAEMFAFQSPMGPYHKESWYRVQCSKCGMQTRKMSSKAQALKTWNRRKNGKAYNTKHSHGI